MAAWGRGRGWSGCVQAGMAGAAARPGSAVGRGEESRTRKDGGQEMGPARGWYRTWQGVQLRTGVGKFGCGDSLQAIQYGGRDIQP